MEIIKRVQRKSILAVAILLTMTTVEAQLSGGGEANPELHTNTEALRKFTDNRFGMFIHWGPIALRGTEIGWSRTREVSAEDYDNLYKEFNPVLFNATEWVRTAKQAGMKYLVLTTRHHDGFSLWDSKYSDYDMASTPYGKGVVKELAEECKKQGLDFGMYYTILDWWHPDYPKTRTATYYARESAEKVPMADRGNMDIYVQYMKNQLKELIELADPSMIWFDGGWEWPWTHEMGMDMYAYLRGIKDGLLINNRVDKGLQGVRVVKFEKPEVFAGDYATPEQRIGAFDNKTPWETCMTIAKQWAWKPNDTMKTKKECIRTLLRTVGGDGNLLFNVGPMLDGRIEQRQIDRLKEMGDWLEINGKSVYGTRGGPYLPTERLVSTHKGNEIYLHVFEKDDQTLTLPFPKGVKINKAHFLDGKTPVKFAQGKESVTINLPDELPDEIASVLVLELNKSASEIDVIERMNY